MAFEPHPWFIGLEGVEHSAEVARTLAWAATKGRSGIIKPTDLRVRAQAVPDDSVRIDPGGFVVESKYANASCQSYIERNPETTNLEVPATGSSGGATRYVVARITDPDYPGGGTIPTVPNDAAYSAPYLVSSLSSSRTEIVLAKITQPANTAAITNAMITDMREMANPREETIIAPRPLITSDNGLVLNSMSAYPDGEWFPNAGGGDNTGRYDIFVPEWATHMQIRCEWLGVIMQNNPGHGWYWVSFGEGGGSNSPTRYTQGFGWNSTDGNYMENWAMAQEVKLRADERGKVMSFFPRANYISRNGTSRVSLNSRGGMIFEVRFKEIAYMDELA